MSVDIEDRIEHDLAELARSAPVPASWPDLKSRIISVDARAPRRHRPRLLSGVVAAAAALIIVVAVLFVTTRTNGSGGTSAIHAATHPGEGNATQVTEPESHSTLAMIGHWGPNGPRLTDAQLMSIVVAVTQEDGTTLARPRSADGTNGDGMNVDAGRRVTGVSVVETSMENVWRTLVPHTLNGLTSSQVEWVERYVSSLEAKAKSDSHSVNKWWSTRDVKLVVVESVQVGSETSCVAGSPDDVSGCTENDLGAVWVFADGSGMPFLNRPYVINPNRDILGSLGSVGTWTPN